MLRKRSFSSPCDTLNNILGLHQVEPIRFLGNEGVSFTYQFTDEDQLTRQGEARAAIIGGKLYMITFEAPRLNYFGRYISDFRALADSAKLP